MHKFCTGFRGYPFLQKALSWGRIQITTSLLAKHKIFQTKITLCIAGILSGALSVVFLGEVYQAIPVVHYKTYMKMLVMILTMKQTLILWDRTIFAFWKQEKQNKAGPLER